jgi:hypothetical protein
MKTLEMYYNRAADKKESAKSFLNELSQKRICSFVGYDLDKHLILASFCLGKRIYFSISIE